VCQRRPEEDRTEEDEGRGVEEVAGLLDEGTGVLAVAAGERAEDAAGEEGRDEPRAAEARRDAVGERRPGDGDDLQPGCRDQVSASGDAHDRADGHAARIVFAVIIVEESNLPHTNTILVTTYAAVGLSVLAHGLTAALLADRYASWYESHPHAARPPMESVPTTAHRLRGNPRTDDTAQTAVPLSTQT
jgi:hypothetical protein